MKPIDAFMDGKRRAEELVDLFEDLHNRRQRAIRSDWKKDFCKLMHWAQKTPLTRIDGKNCIVIVKTGPAQSGHHFSKPGLEELLRAANVMIVSALDRYVHEVVVQNVIRRLNQGGTIPGAMKKLRVPLLVVKEAVDHAKTRRGKGGKIKPRAMTIVRHGLQDLLHQDMTCQSPDEIGDALAMVDVPKVWSTCGKVMGCSADDLKRELNRIVRRRNQIAHEGDIKRKRRGGKIDLHAVDPAKMRTDILWLERLVIEIDKLV